MRTERLKCGCAFTSEPARWVSECAAHKSETQELRARWAADLSTRQASTQLPEEKQA